MAILPKIVYNFNENDTATVRDYSENGNNGTGTGLTISDSTEVGKECVFGSLTDSIDLGNITDLSGATEMAIHLKVKFTSGVGVRAVVDKHRQIEIRLDNSGTQLKTNLFVTSGTAYVESLELTNGVYYDVDFIYSNDVFYIYVDGVLQDSDNTQSGAIDIRNDTMYIGDESDRQSQYMSLNEFKLYNEAITTTIIDSVINEPNGILSDNGIDNGYNVGDIIGTDLGVSGKYGIITFVDGSEYRFLPITDNILIGSRFTRCGHLWDTDRQWMYVIDDTPQMCFYDGISLSSEVLTDAKKISCINKNGIFENSQEISSNTTALDSDTYFIADVSGGGFTLTLPATPLDDKVYKIKDNGNAKGSKRLTIDGNGNNIDGNATIQISAKYTFYQLYFNGVEWFLI